MRRMKSEPDVQMTTASPEHKAKPNNLRAKQSPSQSPVSPKSPMKRSPQPSPGRRDNADDFEYDYMISVDDDGRLVSVESLPDAQQEEYLPARQKPTRKRSSSADDVLCSSNGHQALTTSPSNPDHRPQPAALGVRNPPTGASPQPHPRRNRRPTPPTPERRPLPPRGPPDGREDLGPSDNELDSGYDGYDEHIYINLPSHRLPVAGDSSSNDEL